MTFIKMTIKDDVIITDPCYVVPGFDGVIDYYVDSNEEAHIYGIGNVNFYTAQTGF